MSLPKTQARWTVGQMGSFDALTYATDAPVPAVGDHDVLVKLHAASLNFRDLIIAQGKYPFGCRQGVVPGSDGAGQVVAIGKKVTRFATGDNVLTLFNQGHIGGPLTRESMATGLGGLIDGTLQQYGVYHQEGLVRMPSHLSYAEGASLPCAAVTAWNALFGLAGKRLTPGDVVLTQGTGGVSVFAIQFAKAAGAYVIATTSSAEKEAKLKALGADATINYKENPEWGPIALKHSQGKGADFIVEVGGPGTMRQSLKAVAVEGIIATIGFVANADAAKASGDAPGMVEALNHQCTVRGILVGSRALFEEMNRAIEINKIKPVVDATRFPLAKLKEAYQFQWEQKHFGKVVVTID